MKFIQQAASEQHYAIAQVQFKPGQRFMSQGDVPKKVYVIESGIVKFYVLESNGKEFTVGFGGPGKLLGEIEMFTRQPYFSSVEALHPVKAYALPLDEFLKILEEERTFNQMVMEDFALRIYMTATRTASQMLYPLEYSILKLIVLLNASDISITRSGFANYLGVTVRSVNRAIRSLKEKGILEAEGTQIVVVSDQKLQEEVKRYESL